MNIVPAVIPQSREHLRTTLDLVRHFASAVQIDVVDGEFVSAVSWPYGTDDKAGSVAEVSGFSIALDVEVDLMVAEPEQKIDSWIDAGAKRFVIHVESTQELDRCITLVKTAGRSIGVALNNDTSLDEITEWIPRVDFVQCMGVAEIGAQGNAFDVRVLERIQALRSEFPTLEIAVDGSVNHETLRQIIDAGADRYVVGSAIFAAADPAKAFAALQEYGV